MRSYINQPKEPFGAYIPNGSFALTPTPNPGQGGSPPGVEVGGKAKLGAEIGLVLATKHSYAVHRMPTNMIE